jgi:hypothetical protein
MRIDHDFRATIRGQKNDRHTLHLYNRTADHNVKEILPSQAVDNPTYHWESQAEKHPPKIIETNHYSYNPTGNNIAPLDINFKGNSNEIIDNGNASEIAEKLNDLFFINRKVEILLKGETPGLLEEKDKPLSEIGVGDYKIDGVESSDKTLEDLVKARAEAGRKVLIEEGVRDNHRLKVSKHHKYNSEGKFKVTSRPNTRL